MSKRTIDVSANNAVVPQEIVFETAVGADAPAIAPARVIQYNGTFVSPTNRLPVDASTVLQFSGAPVAPANRLPVDANSSLQLAGTAVSGTNRLPVEAISNTKRGTFTPSGATSTSATPNTWVEVFAANANRIEWFIQNTSDSNIELSYGASTSEQVAILLEPGRFAGRSIDQVSFHTGDVGRIAIRSTAASKSVIAWQILA